MSEPRDIKSALRSLGDALRADFAASESRLGPYRLLHLVGEGAVAEVFAACREDGGAGEGGGEGGGDARLRYAVKVVKPDLAGIADVLARFERERVLLAGLSHECIVRVIDEGTTADGRPWLAMPLVDGNPITVTADELALPLAARVALIARVAEAVGAAHDAGVIHRDLKPANILLERGADGSAPLPRVIDFGVARALAGTHSRLTPHSTAHRLGTPDYMPPEQWEYGIGACEKSSDVYALGIVLGELACGTLPRAERADGAKRKPGATVAPSEALRALAARDAARAADAARLRGFASADALAAELKRSIDPVFARATAAEPAARFADARALCDALRAAT